MTRLLASLTTVLTAGLLALTLSPAQAGETWVKKAQRELNELGCQAGPVRQKLYSGEAGRCDRRPVPAGSGKGRRIVISQAQNWVWLVGPKGGIVQQGGMIDLPSELNKGWHGTGSYCGRAARIKRNTTSSGEVWLENFVRFAPCGIGFHRIPTYQSNSAQMHPDWYLGTNFTQSHGCIRLSKAMSLRLWKFTSTGARVRVV